MFKYQGYIDLVISCGYKGDLIRDYCACKPLDGLNLTVVRELSPLGTGGAIRFATERSGRSVDYWLVVNADTITTLNCNGLMSNFGPMDDCLIPSVYREDASAFGRMHFDDHGRITRFEEKQSGPGWVNMGVYLITRSLVEEMPRNINVSLERTILPQAITDGKRITIYRCDKEFLDMGTPCAYHQAERFLQEHQLELFGE